MASFVKPRTSQLPIDIYLEILKHLPASREDDSGVKTLVSCLKANSNIRAAAHYPFLWKPHYLVRYTHCVEENEKLRKENTKGDWKTLYYIRRRLDRIALEMADEIRLVPVRRHEKARIFATSLSFDVWDALKLESQLPIPVCFVQGHDNSGPHSLSEDALPRKFWAQSILGLIARCEAASIWSKIADSGPCTVSFEVALASISSVFNTSTREILLQLDQVYEACVSMLKERNAYHAPGSSSFDLRTQCVHIQEALCDMGFKVVVEGPESRRVLNQFPHFFLQPNNRETLPLCIAFVFVAIAGRLGIDAQTVTIHDAQDVDIRVHVSSPDPARPDFLLDVRTIGAIAPTHTWSPRPLQQLILLMRAIAYVAHSLELEYELRDDSSSWSCDHTLSAFYFVTTCMTILQQDATVYRPVALSGTNPLDLVALSLDVIVPLFSPQPSKVLFDRISAEWGVTEELAKTVCSRKGADVLGFVGMVVEVTWRDKTKHGCIFAWTLRCDSCQGWLVGEAADATACGHYQAFFDIIFTDGEVHYVSQDNVKAIYPTPELVKALFASCTSFGRYFTGVHLNTERTKGRLMISHELKVTFPDDDAAGAAWVHSQGGSIAEVETKKDS